MERPDEPLEFTAVQPRFVRRATALWVRPLLCEECGARSFESIRWRAYLTADEPPEVASYCPDCAKREFGE